MSCKLKPRSYIHTVVTDGTETNFFQPVSGLIPTADFDSLRPIFEIRSRTSDITLGVALRFTDDGESFSAVQGVGSGETTTGWHYRAFQSNTGSRRFVQVGFEVKNGTAGKAQMANVRLDLAFRM